VALIATLPGGAANADAVIAHIATNIAAARTIRPMALPLNALLIQKP